MMLDKIVNHLSVFYVVFSFSFLVALTGALAPGPLMSYTIIKTVKTRRRGYLTGAWVIAGHAILEFIVVLLLLFGFSFVFKNIIVIRVIGGIGGVILVFFGYSIVRDVYTGKIDTGFLEADQPENASVTEQRKALDYPVIGGIMISMSNPYWWIWWATIGSAFMIQFEISFSQWPRLIAFFLGHETGDFLCYLGISILSFFGIRKLNKRFYLGILIFCGLFMMIFGVYLGLSPFMKQSV